MQGEIDSSIRRAFEPSSGRAGDAQCVLQAGYEGVGLSDSAY